MISIPLACFILVNIAWYAFIVMLYLHRRQDRVDERLSRYARRAARNQ